MKNLVFRLPKAINSGTQIAYLFNCGFWKHPSIGFNSPVHIQVHLVLQKWLLAFFYCGLMHTTACSRCLSAPVTCWAKWQQQTGRDNTKKHCNAVLFFSLCLKENVAVTYHFAILSILKVKKIVWSLNIHTLPCCCLWAMG